MDFTKIVPDDNDCLQYRKELADFLPDTILDAHAHVWEKKHCGKSSYVQRGESWAERIERENPIETLKQDYAAMFPGKNAKAMVFGWVGAGVDIDSNNRYIGKIVSENSGWHGLAVPDPRWSEEETLDQIQGNGLQGLKPYITFADARISTADITISDIITQRQWRLLNKHGYICMLHLPRAGRLPDPKNIEQLLEIEKNYPDAHLIVAHIGRCYSMQDLGDALEYLKDTKNMRFDFSGNTNSAVIEKALTVFGPERILFGSDLPLTHIHMKRIYDEHGHYINLIRPKERPQIANAAYMQPTDDADGYTFYLYESILAFKKAATRLGLSRQEIQNIVCDNALKLLNEK